MIVPISDQASQPNEGAAMKTKLETPTQRPRVYRRGAKPRARRSTAHKRTEARAGRKGSKTALLLRLLRRPDGASLGELTKATGWQPHSVRGFLSGTVKAKMRLKITATEREECSLSPGARCEACKRGLDAFGGEWSGPEQR
jgi:Protein of unknown function (DUF3489)